MGGGVPGDERRTLAKPAAQEKGGGSIARGQATRADLCAAANPCEEFLRFVVKIRQKRVTSCARFINKKTARAQSATGQV
jgi:hypothetical protein